MMSRLRLAEKADALKKELAALGSDYAEGRPYRHCTAKSGEAP